jgi:TRAP-type C4-dicarboxylate transport system substrate-binding protein
MRKNVFIGLVLGVFIVCLFSLPAFAKKDKVTTWKMQCAYPLHTASALGAVSWAEQIEKLTQGRLKVEVYPPAALCATREIIDFIENDVIDCAMSYGGYYTGIVPEANLSTGLPMVHQTITEVYDAWYNRGLIDIVREGFADRNIRYYYYCVDNWYNFVSKTPIKSLEDLKGMKMRALGTFGIFTQKLGASAVSIPGAELYMALKLGTVDGALYSAAGIKDLKLNEVVNYRLYPTTCQITADFYMNQKSIDELPEDVRYILLNSSDDIFVRGGTQVQVQDQLTQIWADKQGVKRVYLSDEDIMKATKIAQQIWDDVAKKNDRCRKGVDLLKQQLRDLGRLD